jgi:hypothetical protein
MVLDNPGRVSFRRVLIYLDQASWSALAAVYRLILMEDF